MSPVDKKVWRTLFYTKTKHRILFGRSKCYTRLLSLMNMEQISSSVSNLMWIPLPWTSLGNIFCFGNVYKLAAT